MNWETVNNSLKSTYQKWITVKSGYKKGKQFTNLNSLLAGHCCNVSSFLKKINWN